MDGNKSNYFLRGDMSKTKISHEERPAFHSQLFINNKTDSDKDKNNLDYDSVIKQFDELISELSHQRNVKHKIVDLSKDLSFENENFALSCLNSKNENARNFDKDFSHSLKNLKLKQPFTGTTAPLNDNIVLSVDLESKKDIFKPEHHNVKQYTDIASSKNILNVNSFLNMKESMPWINSHLWDPKRKGERLLHQKPELLGNTKVSALDFKKNFDECYNNDSPKPMMLPMPQNSNTFNRYYLLKQGNTSADKTALKYNNKTFSCNRITMQEKLCHPKLELASELAPSDIHIEISSCDSTNSPLENEFTEQQTDENLQSSVIDNDPKSTQNFELLLEIENMDLVQNTFNFTCPVCFDEYESGEGVILHDCLHIFCRDCLTNAVCYADGALVKCPYRDDLYTCQSHLQQREIKALVSEEMYEKYLQRSITTAEGLAERSFHCKTPDCKGWCIYDDAINVFHCPVCLHYNCLNCQAIHEGLNCRQYQDKLKLQQKIDKESEKTLALLNDMINSGKALRCPKCDLILLKKWGCDWLKCSVCKTEICWITKGPRWGPGGQGDTSGGCKCGVNGVKCHPSCTYCH